PDCAMQLRVQEHLVRPSLEELEGEVPDELVASLWPRLQSELAPRPADINLQRGRSRAFTWLAPAMAAAIVVLIFSTGYLFSELTSMKEREGALAQQVLEQQRWLAELDVGPSTDPVARTATLAGRNPLVRALSRQETVSMAGLQGLLRSLPGDRTLLTAAQVEDLLNSRSTLTAPLWRETLVRMDGGDGMRARDLLRVLESMDLDPDMTLATAELINLLS
ncbi:hypothetical protein ACFL5A_05245, partial [Gemmatimonadota bacterium]